MIKHKLIPFISLLFLLLLPITCFAFMPSESLECYINYESFPENTVYVDLLLPISPEDEFFTRYNSANGEQFGISEDSQIVQYDTDGYRSYTFHLNDAPSEIRPHYYIYLLCDTDVYDNNSDVFEKAGLTPSPLFDSHRYSFDKTIYLGSDTDVAMEDVCELLDTTIIRERNGAKVSFHIEDDSLSQEDNYNKFWDFCKKYKTAKAAHLDKEGNILSVTDAVSIYETDFLGRGSSVSLYLSGNELTSSIHFAPPVFLIALIFLFIVSVIIISVIIRFIVFIVSYIKQKKSIKP